MLVNCVFTRLTGIKPGFIPEEHPLYPGFYKVPGFDKLLVSKSGKLLMKNWRTDKIIFTSRDWIKSKNILTCIFYDYKHNNGMVQTVCITKALLLSLMFVDIPENYFDRFIRFKDLNSDNITLENLYYGYRNSNSHSNQNKDLSIPVGHIPVEHPSYPGYYIIPGISNYVISKEGNILSIARPTPMLLAWTANHKGYRSISLSIDKNTRVTIARHRLLALMFKDRSGFDKDVIPYLIIDHKNCIPGDDQLDNLEWVTSKINTNRAFKNSITPEKVRIQVRDIDTGEVTNFVSMAECARQLDISTDTLSFKANTGPHRVWPERKQYRKYDPTRANAPWPTYDDYDVEISKNAFIKAIDIKYLDTGEVVRYNSSKDAYTAVQISAAAMSTFVQDESQHVHLTGDRTRFFQCKYAYKSSTPWRKVNNPTLDYFETCTSPKAVLIQNVVTGWSKIFESGVACCKEIGILPSLLATRLKSEGNKVFDDNCTYEYFSINKPLPEDVIISAILAGS